MTVLICVVLGAGLVMAAVACTGNVFDAKAFRTTNHRGREIATGVGVLVPITAFVAEVLLTVGDRTHHPEGSVGLRLVVVSVVAGFSLLGLLDDVAGSAPAPAGAPVDKGFRGHLSALAAGRLTTGAVKLFGGAALAFTASGLRNPSGWAALLVDAALIALAANTANLFDRAPGRCGKVTLLSFAGLVLAVGLDTDLAGVALVVGAALGLLWGDLREQFMLGDSGANAFGAALGLGVVFTVGYEGRVGVLAVLVALNLVAELTSFSKIIDAVPPLRWLDRLGRSDNAD